MQSGDHSDVMYRYIDSRDVVYMRNIFDKKYIFNNEYTYIDNTTTEKFYTSEIITANIKVVDFRLDCDPSIKGDTVHEYLVHGQDEFARKQKELKDVVGVFEESLSKSTGHRTNIVGFLMRSLKGCGLNPYNTIIKDEQVFSQRTCSYNRKLVIIEKMTSEGIKKNILYDEYKKYYDMFRKNKRKALLTDYSYDYKNIGGTDFKYYDCSQEHAGTDDTVSYLYSQNDPEGPKEYKKGKKAVCFSEGKAREPKCEPKNLDGEIIPPVSLNLGILMPYVNSHELNLIGSGTRECYIKCILIDSFSSSHLTDPITVENDLYDEYFRDLMFNLTDKKTNTLDKIKYNKLLEHKETTYDINYNNIDSIILNTHLNVKDNTLIGLFPKEFSGFINLHNVTDVDNHMMNCEICKNYIYYHLYYTNNNLTQENYESYRDSYKVHSSLNFSKCDDVMNLLNIDLDKIDSFYKLSYDDRNIVSETQKYVFLVIEKIKFFNHFIKAKKSLINKLILYNGSISSSKIINPYNNYIKNAYTLNFETKFEEFRRINNDFREKLKVNMDQYTLFKPKSSSKPIDKPIFARKSLYKLPSFKAKSDSKTIDKPISAIKTIDKPISVTKKTKHDDDDDEEEKFNSKRKK